MSNNLRSFRKIAFKLLRESVVKLEVCQIYKYFYRTLYILLKLFTSYGNFWLYIFTI